MVTTAVQYESMQEPATQQSSAGRFQDVVKPRLRGVLHSYAFWCAAAAGAVLLALAKTRRAQAAVLTYTASLSGLLFISSIYHTLDWPPRQRRWMRRADHSGIFLLIAGTYTPICSLGLPGPEGNRLLAVVWAGAVAGVLQSLFWITAPKALVTLLYLSLGWAGVSSCRSVGWTPEVALIALGGVVYSLGAVVYALKWPGANSKTWGYHETFHLAVVVAAAVHFTAIYWLVVE